jgi:hypothetical protein
MFFIFSTHQGQFPSFESLQLLLPSISFGINSKKSHSLEVLKNLVSTGYDIINNRNVSKNNYVWTHFYYLGCRRKSQLSSSLRHRFVFF